MDTQIVRSIEDTWPFLTVEELIGQGSSGEVYRVRREGMGRTYYSAVKVIRIPKEEAEIREMHADGMDERSIYNYFHGLVDQLSAEIDLMESLKSAPNIVCIQDFSVKKHREKPAWIAHIRMELLESLNDYRDRNGLSEEDVLHLGLDLCTALEYCEKINVIHRDIKPANIFVTEFGDFKLGDFSVSRRSWLTSIRSTKGTYAYMAPEVCRGESYDKTVDLYSLGLVMYRLLNENRFPFVPNPPAPIAFEDNQVALARRMGGEPLPPPLHGSRELCEAVLHACAFRPEDRYRTPGQMKEALLQCRGKEEHTGRKLRFSDEMPAENPYRLRTDDARKKDFSKGRPEGENPYQLSRGRGADHSSAEKNGKDPFDSTFMAAGDLL